MTKLKITTQLMGILLASMLVISCGKGGTGKKSKEAEETEKLVDEQKKLVEAFNQKYNLTPDQAKKFEENLTKLKDETSVEELDFQIKALEAAENEVSKGIKEFEEAKNDPSKKKKFLKDFNKALPKGMTAKTLDEAEKILLDQFNQLIKQQLNYQAKNLNQFTQFMSDFRTILENLKKQVELKNKDKKPKGKSK